MALIGIYIFGVCAAIVLNLFVIIVLLRKKENFNYLDILIISLSTCDILKAAVGYTIEINSSLTQQFISSQECKVVGFTIAFLGLVSISHLTGIAVQRCIIFLFPVKARIWSTELSTAWYVVIPSWLYGLVWSIPPLVGWSSYQPMFNGSYLCGPDLSSNGRESGGKVAHSTSYLISLLIFCFIIPMFIISVCCRSIYLSLQKMRQSGQLLGLGPSVILKRRKQERKQCIMGAIVIGTFIIAWSPFAVCVCVGAAGNTSSPLFLQISTLFGKSSSIYNPIIYSFFFDDFQTQCKEIILDRSVLLKKSIRNFAYRFLEAPQCTNHEVPLQVTFAARSTCSTSRPHELLSLA